MARVTPEQAAAKWQRNLSQATPDITAGVAQVSQAPGQQAARQQQAYLANVQANVQKWARRVSAVSLSDWQRAMTEKGIPRVATGAQQAQGKMAGFMAEFLPHVDRVAGQVRAMPKTTLEDGIARAVAQIRGNAQFRRGGGGGGGPLG